MSEKKAVQPKEKVKEKATCGQLHVTAKDPVSGPPAGRCGRGPESCFWPGCAC